MEERRPWDRTKSASEMRKLEARIRELERQLGRKTLEVEILQEAHDCTRAKKADIAVSLAETRKWPVKTIATHLGAAWRA